MSNNPIALDGAFALYEKDIKAYRADSKRSLKQYFYRKHPAAKKLQEAFTIRCLVVLAATLFATHTIYA